MTPLYLDRTFDETAKLLRQACEFMRRRNCLTERPSGLHTDASTKECMRITTRLNNITAWWLGQKAYHAGELSERQILKTDYRLSGAKTCLDRQSQFERMDPELMTLSRKSYDLYRRVLRLDLQYVRKNEDQFPQESSKH